MEMVALPRVDGAQYLLVHMPMPDCASFPRTGDFQPPVDYLRSAR